MVFYFIFHENRKFSLNLFYVLLSILFLLFIDINSEYFLKRNILGHHFNGVRVQSFFGDEWIVGSILIILHHYYIIIFINLKKKIYYFVRYDENYIFIFLLITFLVLSW